MDHKRCVVLSIAYEVRATTYAQAYQNILGYSWSSVLEVHESLQTSQRGAMSNVGVLLCLVAQAIQYHHGYCGAQVSQSA